MTTLARPTAEVRTMPAAEYHASDRLSNSRLKVFRESPALYHARFVAKTIPDSEPTAAMRFGTLVHRGVLEGGLGQSILRIPRNALNDQGHRKGAAWKDFSLANLGRELLKDDEADAVEACIRSVNAHDLAWSLMAMSARELTVEWKHPATGLECKSRLDVCGERCIVDLKTVSDHSPAGFARTCRNLLYDAQHAFYVEAVRVVYEIELPFLFIAVNSAAPHTVRVYELDAKDVAAAHDANDRAMADLARRLETNDWTEPGGDEITTLTLPKNWNADWSAA